MINWKERREDYALEVVPEAYRNWGWVSLVSVLTSAATAMLFLALGGDLMHMYGIPEVIIGMVIVTLFYGFLGLVFALTASRVGLNIDLITSGSGMGYRGAGITSLIYASVFVLYFSIEGSIIADAIHSQFSHVPMWLLYLITGLVFIPLAWYGLTSMNWIMWITLPIYLLLLIWCIVLAAQHQINPNISFWGFHPDHAVDPKAGPAMLQLLAAMSPFIVNATVSADIGRFIPKRKRIIGAIGLSFVTSILAFIVAILLGAWLSFKLGQSNPGIYFPLLIGVWGTLFVIVTQLRVNVLNTYSGSLAFSTFFSRIFNLSPGRHWWILLSVILSIILMFTHVLQHLTHVLTFEGVFIVAWVMAVASYILFNRYIFKRSSKHFSFKKGEIPNWNPIGLSALIIALLASVPLAFGAIGPMGESLAPFVSGGLSFIIVPIATLLLVNKRQY